MQTLQPLIRNGRAVWNVDALPREEFQARLVRLQSHMAATGLDLLFVYGVPFNDKADPCYLSNFVNVLARGVMVAVPREGEPALMVHGFPRGIPAMRQLTWIQDVRAGGDFAEMISKYLKEGSYSSGSLGLVGARPYMPYAQYRALRQVLERYQVRELDHLVADLRRVKSLREVDRIRAAGLAVACMWAQIAGEHPAPLMENSLHARATLVARRQGAEDVRFFLARPRQGEWGIRPAENRSISEGERVMIYLAAEMDRYRAESARTLVVQSGRVVEFNSEVTSPIYESMLLAAVPGHPASAPVLAARAAAAVAGCALADEYGYGNGLGLSLAEVPVIAEKSPDCFLPGMCLSLRLMTRDLGGLMCSDTLVITSRGNEVVTRI